MLATANVNPDDKEDCALTLNGKQKKLRYNDFVAAFNSLKLDVKQQANIFSYMEKTKDKWMEMINISFLTDDFKEKYLLHNSLNRTDHDNRQSGKDS